MRVPSGFRLVSETYRPCPRRFKISYAALDFRSDCFARPDVVPRSVLRSREAEAKSEIRNAKSETNPNFKSPKSKTMAHLFMDSSLDLRCDRFAWPDAVPQREAKAGASSLPPARCLSISACADEYPLREERVCRGAVARCEAKAGASSLPPARCLSISACADEYPLRQERVCRGVVPLRGTTPGRVRSRDTKERSVAPEVLTASACTGPRLTHQPHR
jgi:hypothetical protein